MFSTTLSFFFPAFLLYFCFVIGLLILAFKGHHFGAYVFYLHRTSICTFDQSANPWVLFAFLTFWTDGYFLRLSNQLLSCLLEHLVHFGSLLFVLHWCIISCCSCLWPCACCLLSSIDWTHCIKALGHMALYSPLVIGLSYLTCPALPFKKCLQLWRV